MPPSPQLLLLLLAAAAPAQAPQAAAAPRDGVELRGRVITPDGAPVSGAAVACAPRAGLLTADLLATPGAETDPDGRFVLRSRPPLDGAGPLCLHVAAAGKAAVAREIRWRRQGGADGPFVETDCGDVVLIPGHPLIGRVRDADGQPIAGVHVLAQDLLEQDKAVRSGAPQGFRCAARTDDAGIFRLPCALPCGTVLEFAREGYGRRWLEPVAVGTPLEITLRPTGWVQGRVLDPEGRGVPGATVALTYELASVPAPVTTGADGSFRVPLDRPGRWRLTATKDGAAGTAAGRTGVLSGPRANLEVVLEPTEEAEQPATLEVRAFARDGGRPVERFRAVALWDDYSNRNHSYREYRLDHLLRRTEPATGGKGTVAVPVGQKAGTGVVRVVAEGFAPATVDGIQWEVPEDGRSPEPLLVQLDPEATISGLVRDERSGEPVPGARVAVARKPRLGETYYGNRQQPAAETVGADGSFRLPGLGEGHWQIFVTAPGHPEAPPVDVELARGEQRQGLVVSLPSGVVVRGRLSGLDIRPRTSAFLSPLPTARYGQATGSYLASRALSAAEQAVPVAADGSFAIPGVARGHYMLVVRLPSPPRRGDDLYLSIEPFRVRGADVDRPFDGSEDRPGLLRGRVTSTGAAAPCDQLLVIATPVTQRPLTLDPNVKSRPGPRAFVGRDGAFELQLAPGPYRLTVLDLATAVPLHQDLEAIEIDPGETTERTIELRLVELALTMHAAEDVVEPAAVERVEVRFVPAVAEQPSAAFLGNDRYDTRGGLHWGYGTTRRSIVLPEGRALLLCRNEVAQIRTDSQRWQNEPLGRAELEIALADGAQQECAIAIGAPPVIPDGGDGGGQDTDADGEVRKL